MGIKVRQEHLDFLIAVRDRIAAGWCQGDTWQDSSGRLVWTADQASKCCLFGGFALVAGCKSTRDSLSTLGEEVYDLFRGYSGLSSPIAWSDAEGQTQEGVVAGLNKVIAKWTTMLG